MKRYEEKGKNKQILILKTTAKSSELFQKASEDSVCHMSKSFSYHETFLLFFMSVKLMSAQLGEGVLSISVSTVELRKAS